MLARHLGFAEEIQSRHETDIKAKPRFTPVIGKSYNGHDVWKAQDGRECWINASQHPVFLPGQGHSVLVVKTTPSEQPDHEVRSFHPSRRHLKRMREAAKRLKLPSSRFTIPVVPPAFQKLLDAGRFDLVRAEQTARKTPPGNRTNIGNPCSKGPTAGGKNKDKKQ